MKLGEIIRSYRDKNKMTMDEFARRSGLSKPYISMLEKDKNSRNGKPIVPSFTTLKKVAYAINISIEDLMKSLDANTNVSLVDESFPSLALTDDELELIRQYRCLTAEVQIVAKTTINSLYEMSIKSKVKGKKAT